MGSMATAPFSLGCDQHRHPARNGSQTRFEIVPHPSAWQVSLSLTTGCRSRRPRSWHGNRPRWSIDHEAFRRGGRRLCVLHARAFRWRGAWRGEVLGIPQIALRGRGSPRSRSCLHPVPRRADIASAPRKVFIVRSPSGVTKINTPRRRFAHRAPACRNRCRWLRMVCVGTPFPS